jgi:CheY-like chemotaxis protein
MAIETRPFEILLAEDNQADVELVRVALKEHDVNCSLQVMSDGVKAIEFLNRIDKQEKGAPLDLVLLDMRLPGCDGEEVLQCLRSTERYAQTPVIVMTGMSTRLLEKKANSHTAITYFEKPSTLEEFLQLGSVVSRILAQVARGAGEPVNRGGSA